MHALVTGGGGFLGMYIVEQLLDAGHQVRVFCRGSYDALKRLNVDVVRGDVRDGDSVALACDSVETVFHVAAIPGVWGEWETYQSINTQGTVNVINACRKHHVRRLVYTSSPSVVYDGRDHLNADSSLPYPDTWMCHYPRSKALAEQAVLKASDDQLRTVSLRPHLIWGPRDNHLIPRLLQRARSGRLRRVGDGDNLVSVSYVENTAAAHLQAADSLQQSNAVSGQAYFINEPNPVNLWDWINALLALADLPPVRKTVSANAAWNVGAALEMLWKVLPGEPPMTRFVAAQLSGSHTYSIEAAQRDFGYSPHVSMETGMQRLREWLAAELNGSL